MNWMACELHTHTFHSDGGQSLEELAASAKALGFDCIALTDHNTMSGLWNKETVEQQTGMNIIQGMEWTTFFGHMVTLGVKDYIDWRPVGPGDIHAGLARVHEQGGIAGMAHPFRPGSPMCTGCYWEFELRDWNDLDYIEVWSTTFAPLKNNNARAFRLWTDKLNEGFRIAATSGRDWHRQEQTDEPLSVTYLLMEEHGGSITDKAVAALSAGRATVTLGPRLDLGVHFGGKLYVIGDAVPEGTSPDHTIELQATADFEARKEHWELPEQIYTLRFHSNLGMVSELPYAADSKGCNVTLSREGLRWVRAELWGTIRGIRTMIAFTNPIYFDEPGGAITRNDSTISTDHGTQRLYGYAR
ncbi:MULTISPECIES: CehA/McbA family metallohydrolase [unclassified Paenibacillus]|uniref:CehA/McbA family metallohydrolase n=1 Tax=unclassified Paenibacillus TaxID=185978 RepID=UPI0011A51924|nr:CehA/McbA family metallohydrolase [Paenibacillus sp. Y412MC10]